MNRKQKRQYQKAHRRANLRRADGQSEEEVETALQAELEAGHYIRPIQEDEE